jgi:hypothetical protein
MTVSPGQAVSDWAAVRFGRRFAHNRFRDGSWAEPPMKSTRHAVFYLSILAAAGILAWVGGMLAHGAIQ